MELLYAKTYQEYKTELDSEFHQATESFVKIGYLLRLAKDTDILEESGYKDYQEFARAEYGLESSQVSRFININKKFSEGGYSDHLLPEYQGFGSSKLAIMLNLPDEIAEELTPAYSKSDIQAIKDEIDEENKLSEIEVYLEEREKMPESGEVDEKAELLNQTLFMLFKAEPELYVEICGIKDLYVCGNLNVLHEKIRNTMAPAGEKIYSTRIPGRGRAMLTVNEKTYKIILLRTSEKQEYSNEEMDDGFAYCRMLCDGTAESRWESIYGESYPVAPVQEDKPEWGKNAETPVKTKSDKDKRFVKAAVEQSVRTDEKTEERAGNDGEDRDKMGEAGTDKGNSESEEERNKEREETPEGSAEESDASAGQDVESRGIETGRDDGAAGEVQGGYSADDELAGEVSGNVEKFDPYKAAVGECLRTLQDMLEENNGLKYKNMLVVAKDLVWKLEQATKGV